MHYELRFFYLSEQFISVFLVNKRRRGEVEFDTSNGVSLMQGVIECPEPDKDILRFDARLRLFPPFIDTEFCPLTIKNTLLQSCYLRNTDWACGVAVYTGIYLKCMILL